MIRQAKVDDWQGIARVHVDCIHTDYEGILPKETIAKFTYHNREERWKKDLPNTIKGGTMNFVATDQDGEIIGFALGGTMRDARLRIAYTGEIYGIYVHPSAQGQGYGKKLFEHVVSHLVSLHHLSIASWTFKDHRSSNFFDHLGGKDIYQKTTTIGGQELKEVAYGWDFPDGDIVMN